MKKQFIVSVGIMHAETIEFELNSAYTAEGCEKFYSGAMNVQLRNGKIFWEGKEFEELLLVPKTPNYRFDFVNRQVVKENKYLSCDEGTFWLKDVTIGVNFHWERKEKEKFSGALKFLIEDGMIAAINIIGIEDYLTSVISSEMSADASLELLKAHAVISRSWLIAQIEKSREIVKSERKYQACTRTESELIKWSDREDHTLFDVCADDHCQRYQGLTRESTKTVIRAVDSTWGEVLKYDGKICDARFSKSCGGVFEEFPTCWEPVDYPYLKKKRD
ncbi:MAG: SpoIID/LytB domain-containing protein, partial [Bacteroidales bacterium]|nr:SpoIID/LytB domain-containing protein [Bacteroidales bacterium]